MIGKACGMAEAGFSWRRCCAWTVAIGLHAALFVALPLPILFNADKPLAAPEALHWVDAAKTAAITPVELMQPRAPQPFAVGAPRIDERPSRGPILSEGAIPTAPDVVRAPIDVPVARALAVLDDAGRPLLPNEPLYSARGPQREIDWHTPGDGSEDDIFYRPLALEPNTTRFARAWRPARTLGGEWLEKLVSATSGKMSIPLNAKFNLVCVGSIAGMGGACAIVRNGGSDVIVQRPPPPPWERANRVQCRELRDQLALAADAERVAFLLDRLGALCVDAAQVDSTPTGAPVLETTEPGAGPGSGA